MALIKCHECSGQVSDHARTCPHCGAPVIATIKRRQKAYLIQLVVSLVMAAVLGIIVWFTIHRMFDPLISSLKKNQSQQAH